jgi:alpha-L-arabinofuranosidase
MTRFARPVCALAAVFFICPALLAKPDATLTVDVDAEGVPVAPTLHGLFFEDINYGADGGLYAELVQNRSFEHDQPLYAWRKVGDGQVGSIEIAHESPLNPNNPQFVRVHRDSKANGELCVINLGFDGIALSKGETYLVSFYGRTRAGEHAEIRIELRNRSGEVLASHEFSDLKSEWAKFEAELAPSKSAKDAQLVVIVSDGEVVDLDMISLFPKHTFKDRPNGLRRDLAQTLANMKPGFMRFPGGCIVEGRDVANAYRWKDTIGDVAERKQNANLWQNRESPQYNQTYGLGFFEFFQFCEDIGAEPLPVLNCGMSCQARRGSPVPLSELGPWIQDALDLVEFANGPVTSTWGAKRAAMGHPEPFNMKYLAVGNEQWGDDYFARYNLFVRALKQRYSKMQIISSSGPFAEDAHWRHAWGKFHSGTPADIVDEHYYVQPNWLLKNTDRYAPYDRRGPKVFVGEFAAHEAGRRNSLRCALNEAAYMTGLTRHADVVVMASYAPLLAKYGHTQWQPNLIWFDNEQVVCTPSYHAQAMFAQNRPDTVLPAKIDVTLRDAKPKGMIGVGTWNTQAEYRDIKVTSPDGKTLFESDFSDGLVVGWETFGGKWSVKDGALQQTAEGENVRAVAGDPSWGDYTLTLQARKIGGKEGFLILFHIDNPDSPVWWNIGGWGNTEHAVQGGDFTEHRQKGSIETGRWYNVRVEVEGGRVRAYLDDELVQTEEIEPLPRLYASAGRDDKNSELILELVNPFAEPCATRIEFNGNRPVDGEITLISLHHDDPAAENSRDAPHRVKPVTLTTPTSGTSLQHVVPPYAVQILRVPLQSSN